MIHGGSPRSQGCSCLLEITSKIFGVVHRLSVNYWDTYRLLLTLFFEELTVNHLSL